MSPRQVKVAAAAIYLVLGGALVYHRDNSWLLVNFFGFLNPANVPPWCVGWSSIGVGAGLINTRRNHSSSPWWLHYIGYYGFVLYVVSLASFVMPNLIRNEASDPKILDALSALIGLLGGFLGDRLHEITMTRAAGK